MVRRGTRPAHVHLGAAAPAGVAAPAAPADGTDVVSEKSTYLPQQPGETRLMIVTFAPDTAMMSIDPAAGFPEFAEHIPDLAAAMEPSRQWCAC